MFEILKPINAQDIKYALIANSATLSKGEVIVPSTTAVTTGGGTTAGLLGVVLGIAGDRGKVLEVDSFAAAADNLTVGKVRVAYFPLYIPAELGATLDDDAGTTSGSAGHGNFAVDATGLLLDESTYVVYTTVANKQFFSFGTVDGSATEVTCRYMRGDLI